MAKEFVRTFPQLERLMSVASMAQNLADPRSRWDDNEELSVLEDSIHTLDCAIFCRHRRGGAS